MMMIGVLRPFLCTHGRLNELKDETPFRYAHAEIRTQVVVICDPTCYCLTTEMALILFMDYALYKNNKCLENDLKKRTCWINEMLKFPPLSVVAVPSTVNMSTDTRCILP